MLSYTKENRIQRIAEQQYIHKHSKGTGNGNASYTEGNSKRSNKILILNPQYDYRQMDESERYENKNCRHSCYLFNITYLSKQKRGDKNKE